MTSLNFGASNEGSAWVTHRACLRFLTEASGTNKGGIQCNSFGGSLRASSGHSLSTTLLARPTRFELVTSAFGELCIIAVNLIFCRFSAQFYAERNENITPLRGHSADDGQCSRQPRA